MPIVNELPALKNNYITFACFHDPSKITSGMISLWSNLLKNLPDAKLMFCPDTSKERIIRQFEDQAIHAGRLIFVKKKPMPEYLALHNKVDIMLDSFPYNGGTTSRHALWMGVPVLTLAGRMSVSRVGLSLMSHIGLQSFIAQNEVEYVKLAQRWSEDIKGLSTVRQTLRQKVQQAPFSNADLMTRALEAAYRQMWVKWCAQQNES